MSEKCEKCPKCGAKLRVVLKDIGPRFLCDAVYDFDGKIIVHSYYCKDRQISRLKARCERFAAAPDLLEALERIIREAEEAQEDYVGVTKTYAAIWTHPFKEIVEIAQAAIAKATGRE